MIFNSQRLDSSPSEKSRADGRSPQLDGLRGAAILAVVLHHSEFHPPHFLDWGPFGVRVFFVLSAYLITTSLWRLCGEVGQGRSFYVAGLQKFHLRRFARVLPAYMAALVCGALIGIEEVRESLLWHLGFLSNFDIAMRGWFPTATGHFWSLSVQEQFYLLWPFVLFLVPIRFFPWVAVGLIGTGYAYRVWCFVSEVPNFWCWLMLPGWLDSFAMGGLLAWIERQYGLPRPAHRSSLGLLAAMGAVGVWILNRGLRYYQLSPWVAAIPDILESMVAVFLVWVSVVGVRGPAGWFLGSRPLRYLGKISYGIFVYHLIVFYFLSPWLLSHGIGRDGQPLVIAASMLAVTIPLSVASWYLLEQPVMKYVKEKWMARHLQEPEPK